jgi:hypothetical protein
MIVRVKLNYVSSLRKAHNFNRQAALGVAALLTPASLMAFALGGWRLCADLNITGQFAIANGIFSHWQVWLALGAAMQVISTSLYRFATRDDYEGDETAIS